MCRRSICGQPHSASLTVADVRDLAGSISIQSGEGGTVFKQKQEDRSQAALKVTCSVVFVRVREGGGISNIEIKLIARTLSSCVFLCTCPLLSHCKSTQREDICVYKVFWTKSLISHMQHNAFFCLCIVAKNCPVPKDKNDVFSPMQSPR